MITGKQPNRVVRLVVSVALLTLLLLMIDWDGARVELAAIPLEFAIAAMAIFAIQFVISTWKWRASLFAHGVDIPFGFLLRTYCIGAYFSSFLPSNIGGDIYRAVRTSTYSSVPVAMLAVILERLLGLVALIVVGAVGVLWLLLSREWISMPSFAVLTVAMVSVYFALPVYVLNSLGKSEAWQRWIPTRLSAAGPGFRVLASNKSRLIELLLACLVFQVVATLAVALLFIAVGAPWLPAESAIANAAGSLAAILPVSINGIGVTEASFAGVASRMGVDFTMAAVVSLLVRILVLPLVLAFGVVYMFEAKVKPGDAAMIMETEKA